MSSLQDENARLATEVQALRVRVTELEASNRRTVLMYVSLILAMQILLGLAIYWLSGR